MRLDIFLVEQGFFVSRTLAQRAIKSNSVVDQNGKIHNKSSEEVADDNSVFLINNFDSHYVSRGALKLLEAINKFSVNFEKLNVIDIGASTGGFSQVLLENNAKKIYAVDVGHKQLDKTLIDEPKVLNIEGYNFKNAVADDFSDAQAAVVDVSFISLSHIFNSLKNFNSMDFVIALIKPQFEVGNIKLKNGVVKNPKLVIQTLERLFTEIESDGFYLSNFTVSPIKGVSGNVEFLGLFTRVKEKKEIEFSTQIKKAY